MAGRLLASRLRYVVAIVGLLSLYFAATRRFSQLRADDPRPLPPTDNPHLDTAHAVLPAHPDNVYKFGVVGYGMSAKVFHLPLIPLVPNFRLHAIVQRTPTPNNSAPADHPSLTHYTTTDALFADPAVDVVVITTPPDTHYPLTKAALLAGKHVVVEKPFMPSSAHAAECRALARKHGRLLTVYQNRRWDTDFLTLQRVIASGRLGRIHEFATHYDRLRPAKPDSWKGTLPMDRGGGVIFDLGPHILDQAYTLFGLPRALLAAFSNQREGLSGPELAAHNAEPDSVTGLLRYDGGLVVTVKAAVWSVQQPQLRFWVRGTHGTYTKYGIDPQEEHLKAGRLPGELGFGAEAAELAGTLETLDAEGRVVRERVPSVEPETYLKFYESVAVALAGGPVAVSAQQGVDVLRIIEAFRKSEDEGRFVSL